MAKPTSGTAQLRPRARILRTFGDELISSETVAVIELVKNSYDADASRVLVRFTGPLEVGAGAIDVIDDGHGMSTETVTTVWMEPATLFRAAERRSEVRGRRVLGEKGIGRFAASRLANRLLLVTRRPEGEFETTALFDWSQFDDEDSYLSDVEVLWEETEPQELTPDGALGSLPGEEGGEANHGTFLHMEGLRTEWDREKVEALNRALSRLISPFASTDEGGPHNFHIAIEVPGELSDLSGEIGPVEALQNPEYLLRGHIAADGRYEFTLRNGRKGKEEKKTGVLKPEDRSAPTCGPLDLELRVWDRDPAALRSIAEEQGLGVRNFRRELDEFSGVSVYRDGFRVFPYGERGDDWLELDPRRVNQPSRRISNNQIAGYVSISHEENPELRDQTNREGLMQNRAYEDLRDLVVGALQLIEEPRWRRRKEEREQKRGGGDDGGRGGAFNTFNLEDLRDTVRDKTGADPDIEDAFDAKQKAVEAGADEVRDLLGSYERLASLGRLVDAILHDGRAPLASIDSDAYLGLRKIQKAKRDDDPITAFAEEKFGSIRDQAGVLDALFKRIAPLAGRKRGRPKKVVLEELIRQTFDLEHGRIDELGVRLHLPKTSTEATVEETDIRIILYNLLDNALHWLRDTPEDKREITVRVKRRVDGVEVLFSDSGPGVEEEDREQIFQPYFTRKVSGWGIGLSQVEALVGEYYDGSLELVDNGPLRGATFRIMLRRRV
jgi:signal transduction histidine kinase